MPELAEVEFYRKQWNCGLQQKIVSVGLHAGKRIFRGTNVKLLKKTLTGAVLESSHAHGKQMLFRFSNDAWLGIHLGMTGKLSAEERVRAHRSDRDDLGKHDHLVLRQARHNLVFSDPRQFGRVLFHVGKEAPSWWRDLPPSLVSKEFTLDLMTQFLQRHGRAPIKAVLLSQKGFPGVGNWMADEILWRARLAPQLATGKIREGSIHKLWKEVRFVCENALQIVGKDFGDLPASWLFDYRWQRGGNCPRCRAALKHATVGGRTTCWCPVCQM